MKHMPHGHRYLTVALFATAIAVLVLTLASAGRPAPVAADLGDGHTTSVLKGEFDPAARPPGRITRNLIDGEPLTVCSDVFPKATADAVERWNDKLSREVLTFEKDSVKCQNARRDTGWTPRKGVKTVFVSVGEVTTDQMGEPIVRGKLPNAKWCVGTPIACVRQDDVDKNGVWRTRYGRMEVIVNPEKFCHDTGMPGGNSQCMNTRDDDDLRHLITHELGHALSLADYYCNHYNDAGAGEPHPDIIIDVDTIMDTLWRQACNPGDGSPTDRDKNDYIKIYTPTVVVVGGRGVDGRRVNEPEVDGQTVTLHWNQANVFVESDFEIQRKNGMIWEAEEIAPANDDTVTLTNQPGGEQRYRIRARTLALCPADEDCRQMRKHVYGDPSAEIEVPVQFLAPTHVRVTSRTSTRLTLAWDLVDGADRYDLRRITPDATCESDDSVKDDTTKSPYSFTPLSHDTPYHLCVRATLSTNSDVASEWVKAAATTKAQQLAAPSSPSAGSATTNSLTLTWTAVNDEDVGQYEVKHNHSTTTWTVASTRTSYTFSLNPNTDYILSVRALARSGSGRTDSRWAPAASARTKAESTPQPTDPRQRPPRPEPVVTNEEVGRTVVAYRWRAFGDLPGGAPPNPPGTCYLELYQRDRYALVDFTTWWTFNESRWIWELDESTKRETGLESEHIYTDWYTQGRRSYLQCPTGAQGAADVAVPPAGTLLPGDYVLAWGGEWYSFTIPSGAEVSLTNRAIGEREAMVFGVASGAEIVIVPAQVAADLPTSDNATLAAIVESFRAETDSAKRPAGAERRTCTDSPPRDDAGALSLDLNAQWCSVVSSGGAVTVSYGAKRLSLTVPADRTWLIFAASQSESTEVVGIWIMDRQTKAYVILNPADGAELARHAPADADDLPALLDALAASASAPAATE